VTDAFRCGLVGLAGRPNVGKSTLVNALCGSHVSIVSDKPQTTRRRVAGLVDGEGWQIVLLDLPGYQRPRDGLTGRMQQSVDETLADVDVVLFVLDGTEAPGPGDRFIAERAFASGRPVVIALNKVDRLSPSAIGQAIEQVAELGDFQSLHPISAATRDGIGALRDELAALMPEGPQLYPTGAESGDPLRVRLGELVREAALARTRDEVPHAIAVLIDEVTPPTRRAAGRLGCTLLVDTESQKGILVGKGGAMIRDIGSDARLPIQKLMGGKMMVALRVEARKGWRDDPRVLDQLGP
jgi:GTP-binding protein Era